jgi:hypothetical protein
MVYPLGPQTVSMALPRGVKVNAVSLLRSETKIPFRLEGSVLGFTILHVADYEIVGNRLHPPHPRHFPKYLCLTNKHTRILP